MQQQQKFTVLTFDSQEDWRRWLEKHHSASNGVWIRFYKKASDITSLVYSEALDEALCYGWIDSQVKKYDDLSYIQKFTPRKSKSIWSKVNREHITRLMKEGRMTPAGLKRVEEAKNDGRWKSAYDSPTTMEIPKDFLSDLSKFPKAKAFFETLNKSNVYAIAWRLQTAKKPETREKRKKVIIEMLQRGEKFH